MMSNARIRKTGEEVHIICFSCTTSRNMYDKVSYIDSKGVEHKDEHLNYYWDFENIPNLDAAIDWEQRRYEIAKDVAASLAQKPNAMYDNIVSSAIRVADKLIERLKEK